MIVGYDCNGAPIYASGCSDPCSSSCTTSVCEVAPFIQWTPSIDTSGPNLVLSDIVRRRAVYAPMGKLIVLKLHFDCTCTDIGDFTGDTFLRFTLPIAALSVYSIGGACLVSQGGATLVAGTYSANSLLQVNVGFQGGTKWTAGILRTVSIDATYERA